MTSDQMKNYLSVIVPTYNNKDLLSQCLNALVKQTYPKECFEVIVIDNCSTENIKEVVNAFPGIKYSFEGTKSSYAARNNGVQQARGEIIAFTDSDCLPDAAWLANGSAALLDQNAGLAGGKITFILSPRISAAEIIDTLFHMNTGASVKKGHCQTANLFVRSSVFDEVGLFPDWMQSGGDAYWTKKATHQGHRLIFVPEAVVYHPARRFSALMQKYYRTGYGHIALWMNQGRTLREIAALTIRRSLPQKPSILRSMLKQRYPQQTIKSIVPFWITCFFCTVFGTIGRFHGLLYYLKWKRLL
jgi:GT2 family glycosyltransferase